MIDFNAALRAERTRLGLTRTQLGELLPDLDGAPTHLRTIQQWESGERKPAGYAQPLILAKLKAARPRP